jgi:predicted NBD/HSP70 family sugar kinase
MKTLNITRYNLKKSLYKVFKKDIYILDETHLAALSNAYRHRSNSLLYLLVDNKISNSFVFDYNLVELEDDINLKASKNISKCDKDAFKTNCLSKDLDDEYVSAYFLSNNDKCKKIVEDWCELLDKEINKIIKILPVKTIVFAGYLGEYYREFAKYMNISKKAECFATYRHRENTLVGVSHLIFKDN